MVSFVQSSRHLHALVSWTWLRTHGCQTAYPVFLDTRDVEIGTDVTVGRRCQIGGAIRLGDHTSLGERTSSYGDVTIGRGTRLNPRCELRGTVSIGRYCAVARDTVFQETGHDYTKLAVQHPLYERVLGIAPEGDSDGPITIGNDVWIGADTLILSGVEVGDGAIIAGKSVVTDDVDPYSVVAGAPAEHKHYRFSEAIRERLLEIEWWEWSESEIVDNKVAFQSSIESVDDLPTTKENG